MISLLWLRDYFILNRLLLVIWLHAFFGILLNFLWLFSRFLMLNDFFCWVFFWNICLSKILLGWRIAVFLVGYHTFFFQLLAKIRLCILFARCEFLSFRLIANDFFELNHFSLEWLALNRGWSWLWNVRFLLRFFSWCNSFLLNLFKQILFAFSDIF